MLSHMEWKLLKALPTGICHLGSQALYFPVWICLPAGKLVNPLCGPWLAGSTWSSVVHRCFWFEITGISACSGVCLSLPMVFIADRNGCPRLQLTLSYSQHYYRCRDKGLGVEKSCDLLARAMPKHRPASMLLDRCRLAVCQEGKLEDPGWAVLV